MASPSQTKRITVRLSSRLRIRLEQQAALAGKSESRIVREAVEEHLSADAGKSSAYDLARRLGLPGSASGLPADLSTKPRHFTGFGSGK